MTGKRYSYDPKQVAILKDGKFWLEGQIDTACNHSEICNELNQLSEENDELKQLISNILFKTTYQQDYSEILCSVTVTVSPKIYKTLTKMIKKEMV